MKKLIISQRFEKIGDHNELRDNLDVRLSKFIFELNYLPILLPGNIEKMNKYLNVLSPEGIILSGGGDPFKKDKRYLIEKQLIDIAIKKQIPLLGICRGAQRINIHFNGKLKMAACIEIAQDPNFRNASKHIFFSIFGLMVQSK